MKRTVFKKCLVEGCEGQVLCNGLCSMHYQRRRAGITDMRIGRLPRAGRKIPPWKPNDPRYKNKNRLCDVPDCNEYFHSKGLCEKHYNEKLRKGFLACKVSFFRFLNCSVSGCDKQSIGNHGLCSTHYERTKCGIDLNRPIGVSGELSHWWKGGIAEYPNHYEMKKIRKQVLEEENWMCYLCGKPTKQIHHLDGSKSNHDRSNIRACCHSCNLKMAGPHQSKYTKAYGKNLRELSEHLKVSIPKVARLHRTGMLRRSLHIDEIEAVLF